ncbi:MAG: ImmA/IrrE family metallo-endopeptidase [Patescibacteria group bacterium]
MKLDNKIEHNKIEYKASQVLEAYNIIKPVVDVSKIAKGEGIEIKEISMPKGYHNVAGFYEKDKKIIYIEKTDSPQRKLFSIAHELGHVFLNHQHASVLYRITRGDDGLQYHEKESEANSFAAHLLIPEFMLRDYMRRYNLSKSDYEVLADIFGVPITSMRYTLEYLK